jgi:hypothetical protein
MLLRDKSVLIRYRLPGEHKSSLHELLFGRRMLKDPQKRTLGKLSPYILDSAHGMIFTRRKNFKIVKAILASHNVTFDTTLPQIKASSLRRRYRRQKARKIADLEGSIESEWAELAEVRPWAHRLDGQQLERNPGSKTRPLTLEEWYELYVCGKVYSCVHGERRNAEPPLTVARTIQSILRMKMITPSRVEYALYLAAYDITDAKEADRLVRLVHMLELGLCPVPGQAGSLIDQAAQALHIRLKKSHVIPVARVRAFYLKSLGKDNPLARTKAQESAEV